jgi:peptidyl-prolyl cis-trans isomerase D
MMKFLRSQSQTVLMLILIVIGVSFFFYGNVGNVLNGAGRGSTDYGRIDGQDLSVADLYNAVRTTRNSLIMTGRAQLLSQPDGRKQLTEEAWRQLLLQHEADRLHIEISDQELIDYIRSQPPFQKDGVYSPELFQTFMSQLEDAYHISPDAFEDMQRNSLRTEAVYKALFSPVRTSTKEVDEQYDKYYGPVQLSVITFDPKTFAASAQVAPAEIEAEYQAHPDNPAYRTAEKRKVDYVLFPLSADQAKLPAKEKSAAIEALGEKALNFAIALQPDPTAGTSSGPAAWPDFQAEAKKMGLTPATTDFFTADAPPAGLPPSPSFNNAAFALSKDDPVSKVVELDNGVAVLHLDEIQPSNLRPLDEVKGDIAQELQQAKDDTAAQRAAQNATLALQAAMAKGTDFKAAAAAMNLPVQTMPAFVPATAPRSDMRLQTLAYAATSLKPGDVSGPIPVDSDHTIVVVHLDNRAPSDKAGLSAFETGFRQRQDEQLRSLVFVDWANWMDHQPGTHKPPDLDEYGGVE